MADTISDAELEQLLQEGLSQNEIARRTNIPRSTLRRKLKKFSTPQVYISPPISKTRTTTGDELQEMLEWWRQRKHALQIKADTEQETQRQTYHVQKRYIEAIKRAADLEGVSIMEIVNRAFKQFFDTLA